MERGGHGEGGQLPGNLLGRRGQAGQDHGNHAGGSQSSVKFVHFKMRPSSHPRQPGECKLIEHCVIHSLSIPGNLVTCNFKVYITIHFFSQQQHFLRIFVPWQNIEPYLNFFIISEKRTMQQNELLWTTSGTVFL